MDANYVWGTLGALGFAYEAYTILNGKSGDTLSERTRSWFRTRTTPGKFIFTACWVSFSTWFLIHILGG